MSRPPLEAPRRRTDRHPLTEGPRLRPDGRPPSALRRLRELLARSNGTGIDTSEGLLFNHTIWGRDRAITALDVLDHRPEAARQSILALARLQGTRRRFRSEEEPGRIHNEHRDFRTWQAPLYLKFLLRYLASPLWGGDPASYTSYFASDSTPLYLMMLTAYARNDPGILDEVVERRDGSRVTIRDTALLAAVWLLDHTAGDGLVEIAGRNPLSLPSPMWRDGPTSNLDADLRTPNFLEPVAWLDMQFLTFEAFRGLADMLRREAATPGRAGAGEDEPAGPVRPSTVEAAVLLDELALAVRDATLRAFWMPGEQYFGFALDRDFSGRRRLLRAVQSNAGWLLAGGFFDDLPEEERATYVSGIARKLFFPDMLTDAGLRGRSLRHALPGFLNYHEPVWPMDSVWIARGLRRQGLGALAEQIENRVVNAVNALGAHYEFIPVDAAGRIVDPARDRRSARSAAPHWRPLPTEMIPDVDLAWSVTGVLRVKWEREARFRRARETDPIGEPSARLSQLRRRGAPTGPCPPEPNPWAAELTRELLARIEDVRPVASSADLADLRRRFAPRYLNHRAGLLKSAGFILLHDLGRALPAGYLCRIRHRRR